VGAFIAGAWQISPSWNRMPRGGGDDRRLAPKVQHHGRR